MYFYAYLQKDQTINAEYYFRLLCQLQEALKEKQQSKLQKGFLFLQHYVPTYRTGKIIESLKNLGFDCIDNPPDTTTLVPYWLLHLHAHFIH